MIVGRRMRRVAERDALEHVFGYTVGNDVSARDVQFSESQWVRGKSFDTFCPLGPVVVTADEIPDPQALTLRTRVNGEVMQESSTAEMVFGVAELLAFCSRSFTLEPGDVVLTGTPWGCGEFMDPPRSLAPGDLVESEIEGIGTLRNPRRQAVPIFATVNGLTCVSPYAHSRQEPDRGVAPADVGREHDSGRRAAPVTEGARCSPVPASSRSSRSPSPAKPPPPS